MGLYPGVDIPRAEAVKRSPARPWPSDLLRVAHLVIETAVEDPHPPVGQGPQRPSMGLSLRTVGVVVAAGADGGAERAERPHLQRVGESSVAREAGQGNP